MKKTLLIVFIISFNCFALLAQQANSNDKLVRANEKVAYYIENAPADYEEVSNLPYDLPWSDYENLSAFKLKEIKKFMEAEKEMKGKNIFYLAFSIIYQEYEKGNNVKEE